MLHPADRRPLPRDTLLFLVCLVVSVLVLLLPGAATQAAADAVRRTALAPLVVLQEFAEEGRTSRARFQAVVAERDSAAVRAVEVEALRRENAQLRRLVGLGPRPEFDFVAAEVLWQTTPTDGHTLLLSAGSRDGAAPFQPVITPAGLLGVVARVGPGSSIARTWAHPEFRASGITEDGTVLGIVAPVPGADLSTATLEFRGTAYRDTVAAGTLVLTAGLGGVFPRGIPIGRVRGVKREELGWERVYVLAPVVNPGATDHVLLLRSVRPHRPVQPLDPVP
jgi:rod shape-determining protein MreC